MNTTPSTPLALWAGVECTFNRVGDRYVDQCTLNGHDQRVVEDLRRFAALGVERIRYPFLWEKIAPDALENANWSLADLAANEMQTLGIKPIAGLVHHGSGPRHTSLLDPEFPEKLAAFALEVAKRYPWIDAYTPVNEPLTTARFSGLYGFWYPHKTDDASFVRALYNELRATVLAMRAIRTVQPNAQLIQTEDLGLAKGTPALQYQVDYENTRRWLTFDFLCGHIDESHSMFRYLVDRGGLTPEEVLSFRDDPVVPDVLGVNHYPLSNRFLDDRIELYPPAYHGGNGRDRYVDVGAIDSGQVIPPTPKEVLRELWERYRLPFAVTEVHISAPREQQMRWLDEVRRSAEELRAEGADCRAVTSWSLLGSYGWSTLCTCDAGHENYESGIFDTRRGEPRATLLTKMVSSFAQGRAFEHPLLERPGFWAEPTRVIFAHPEIPLASPSAGRKTLSRPILITGARGTLGQAFTRVCQARGIDCISLDRAQLDITSPDAVEKAMRELKPWAVINAAGYSRIESAEREPDRCFRDNTFGAEILARACANHGCSFLTFSSDLVFDGSQREPYTESSAVYPLNVYGRSKAEAEQIVRNANPSALIIRTSSLYGPGDSTNFISNALRSLRSGQPVRAAKDIWISPTYVPDLVHLALDLLIDRESGIHHLANQGVVTWLDCAQIAAEELDADRSLVIGCSREEYGFSAPRPAFTALRSERLGKVMRNVEHALQSYIHEQSSKLD